ncbi:hypothetical protein Dsin_009329 [Dipteronia sinensis]|uniref:Myb/SANT-like domain-containing protein n=1 Tax=Dipteronia sinensis TaxID=43782 RepID=A0AAE0ARL0_9ROSI|nr:hypothetical protein Dsin_009329 [Dipteronia sinensis]
MRASSSSALTTTTPSSSSFATLKNVESPHLRSTSRNSQRSRLRVAVVVAHPPPPPPPPRSRKKNRASWSDPSHRKRFLDLCLHEINNGFRSGRTLKPSAWARIVKELDTSIGKHFHQKQLKNGWDYMRKQYLEWIRLNYPEARKFHHRPLANVEELEILFGGVFVTGIPEIGNTSSVHSTSVTSKRMIKLENGCSVPTPHSKSPNFDYPILDEEESGEKSEKRRKVDETTSEEQPMLSASGKSTGSCG